MNIQFFDGLNQYEIVLLLCGILIFFVLLAGLIVYLVRGKELTGLLIAFLIPIVMIGFPGISSISLSKDKFELKKILNQVQQNPTDQAARQELEEAKQRIESRAVTNPETLTDLAKAQFILNEPEKAKDNLDKALKTDPQLPAAVELKRNRELINEVEKLTNQVEAKPTDAFLKNVLTQKVEEAEKLPIASSDTFVKIGRAQEIVGKTSAAKESAVTAVAIDPKSVKAIELQRRIESKKLQMVAPK